MTSQPSPRSREYPTGSVCGVQIDDVTDADGSGWRRELRVFMRDGRVVSERISEQELATMTGGELMDCAHWFYGREPQKRRGVRK